jgi:5-methylcytosine-specific restriction endonuclease McrA
VPSKWPGCCSQECKAKRAGKHLSLVKEQRIKMVPLSLKDRRWLSLRYEALRKYGNKCHLCNSNSRLQVDHIKPISKYPNLKYVISNLQILCEACNKGKGNKFIDDWR